jgi:hypothetical protein
VSSESPATRMIAAAGWGGLVLFLGWQEYFVETERRWLTPPWWFRIPATAMFGLALLIFALECLMQEMTVRRWATSALVFGVFGVLFLAAGILDPESLMLPRWLLIPAGIFYLVSSGASGIGAKDNL